MLKKIFLFMIIVCCSVSAQTSYRNLSSEDWTFNRQTETKKHKATIPGTVHSDLFENQLIPDPFFGNNEKELQWIENENWVYESTFSLSNKEISNENIELEFDGLDTYATVYVNGRMVLEADNMFRKWTVDAKKHLKKGKNHLKIIFQSAVQKGKEEAAKLSYILPEKERVFVRKAQYQFGWDWGPRFVTAGIWKKVQLKLWNNATFEVAKHEQVYVSEKLAKLNFILQIKSQKDQEIKIFHNEKYYYFYLIKGKNELKIPVSIENPKLWWCNGLGDPYQFLFQFEIVYNDTIIDYNAVKVGIRKIELIQDKDEFGTSFYFKLNGKPVFMKGANYIPPDSFIPKKSSSSYHETIQNARKANMNMLRVWGGGVYADDEFYNACDANGILVWQDFMFACAMYPGDEKFLENVKQEVIDNVNRLQNHPSIALWCGNNENDEGWKNWGWQKQFNYSSTDSIKIWNDYKKIFHEIIPQTLERLLSKEKNIYWPSSPSIGWGRKESLTQGDSHYWGVWWGKEPFEKYKQKVGRFMSEYGFQGMPNLETLQKVMSKEDLKFSSDAFKNHQKHPTGFETINEYMFRDYEIPTTIEKYNYVSQLLQAHGMKIAIEAHRLAKPYCMGSLYWQLNDCWPVTSWSTLDYYGNWKAAHYQVKESFAPIFLAVTENENGFSIIGNNDNLEVKEGVVIIKLFDFYGKELWTASKECTLDVEKNTTCMQISYTDLPKFIKEKTVLQLEFNSYKKKAINYHYFVKPKELQLEKPDIEIKIVGETLIELKTNTLAKNVYLQANDTFFEENYFDLIPGFPKIIKTQKPTQDTKVMSLFDVLNK
jgi:beta-mannosidase